ncbi:MAG: pilin [bacterium]
MKINRKQILVGIALFSFLIIAMPVLAADLPTAPAKQIDLSISIGGKKSVADLPQYLGILYKWFVGAAMVIAAFMITFGGFQYMLAGGVPKLAALGKKRIINSLIGLLLAIGSYVLLYQLNPGFVELKLPDIREIKNVPLPGALCDNPKYLSKCDCGVTCEGPAVGMPEGKKCLGMGNCGTGKCVNVTPPLTEAGFGAEERKMTLACLNHSKCRDKCEDITSDMPKWKEYCEGNICDDMDGRKEGCYAIDIVQDGRPIKLCTERAGLGKSCGLVGAPCKVGLLCNTGMTPSTCILANGVEDQKACSRDIECKNKLCNMNVGIWPGRGLCVPKDGYKTLQGNDRFSDCDEKKKQMCGAGWDCIDDAPNDPFTDWVCSDLETGSPCEKKCTKNTDACLINPQTYRTRCVPK